MLRHWAFISLSALLLSCSNFGKFWEGPPLDSKGGSSVTDVTPPTTPTGWSATSGGSTQITLNWTASLDETTLQSALVYEICQSTTASVCSTFTVTFTTGAGAVNFNATGLTPSTAYYYRIRAKDAAGNTSAPAVEVTATTAASVVLNSPTATPSGGTYNATQNVTLSSTSGVVTICYTTAPGPVPPNPAPPNPACDVPQTGCVAPALLYGATVNIASDTQLKAIACRVGDTVSPVSTHNYTIDTVAPTVTGITSSAPDATYYSSQGFSIQVTFSEIVNVTGTPQLSLATGSPSVTAINYTSGSGTNTLNFSFSVAGGNFSSDLDYSSTAALALNGGVIIDVGGNAANLTLPSPGAAGSLGANKAIVIDGVAPSVTSVTAATPDGNYGVSSVISIQVTFSEPVTVSGTPTLTLSTSSPATTAVSYSSGSGTATLTFLYTVAAGNSSPDLEYLSTSALSLNGGSIRDAGLGSNDAALTLPATGSAGSLGGSKNIVIDGTTPTVSNVTAPVANSTYGVSTALTIEVYFSEPVFVGGTPQINLATGAPATTALNYASGSGTSTLVFNYLVAAGNNSSDLDYASSAALVLNGGSIQDAAGNQAVLTLAAPGAAGSLGANKAIVIDGVIPVISGVTPASSAIVVDTKVSYTFSENCQTASVQWNRTGGAASGNFTASLVGGELTAGTHSMITLANAPTLVAGAIYQMIFNCTDAAGNTATPVNVTNVTYGPPGSTWSARTLPVSQVWTSVAYGNGIFVAGSETLGTTIATSPDGITWTSRTMPSSNRWSPVVFGGGKFVIAGQSSTVSAASTDGITWTTGTFPSADTWITGAYGNSLFVMVPIGASTVVSSPDGINWTTRTLPVSATWISATFGNGIFVVVSASSSNVAVTSADGITWTQRTLPLAAEWKSVGFGNGIFVALAQNSTVAATSTDGITWTLQALPSVLSWQLIAYGNGVFVAPANGSTTVITSPDGVTWTSYNTMPSSAFWTSIAFGAGSFVTVANGSATAAVSP